MIPKLVAGAVLPGVCSMYQRLFDPESVPIESPAQIYTFSLAEFQGAGRRRKGWRPHAAGDKRESRWRRAGAQFL